MEGVLGLSLYKALILYVYDYMLTKRKLKKLVKERGHYISKFVD
jgi:hypothetical protein